MENFIGEYEISKDVCDHLIYLMESNLDKCEEGHVSNASVGGRHIDYNMKKSTDFNLNSDFYRLPIVDEYYNELQRCLVLYMDQFPETKDLPLFAPSDFKIQKYEEGDGFFSWHWERGGGDTYNRALVFMTYLNDVEDGGETSFKYQGIDIKPEKGKTLIWPSDWTYTHRGNEVKSGLKYIATGWYIH